MNVNPKHVWKPIFAGVLCWWMGTASATDSSETQILVKFKGAATPHHISALVAQTNPHTVQPLTPSLKGWFRFDFAARNDAADAFIVIQNSSLIETLEWNQSVRPHLGSNDPALSEQWGLERVGAPHAWQFVTGGDTVVAVIDTGIDYTHPDLAANMWINPGEIPENGIDEDGNGYIDDVYGYDFGDSDSDPMDSWGHGTHVAGIIGAAGNNAMGGAGVNWQTRLMALKYASNFGGASLPHVAQAIAYAVTQGARVINASFGFFEYSALLKDAIGLAESAGVLVVTSAGNNAVNLDIVPQYPAAYTLSNILVVAAAEPDDTLWSASNFGVASVHLAAPGDAIFSTLPSGGCQSCGDNFSGYGVLSGTSMAAPFVSGAAALLLAQQPSRNHFSLRHLLLSTTDPTPGPRNTATGGRLNAGNAVDCLASSDKMQVLSPRHDFYAFKNEPLALSVHIAHCGEPIADARVTARVMPGDKYVALFDDGNHQDFAANDGVYGTEWVPQSAGKVKLTISARGSQKRIRQETATGTVAPRLNYHHAAAPYSWIDPPSGSGMSFPEQGWIDVAIGFRFPFYDRTYTHLRISEDGYLTFSDAAIMSPENMLLPTPTTPNAIIAPFWDQLSSVQSGRVHRQVYGRAPNRRLVITWRDLTHEFSEGDGLTFQAILHETSGKIIFQYADVNINDANIGRGMNATIGIEDQRGVQGLTYSHFSPTVSDGMAVAIAPPWKNELKRTGQ